MVSIVPLNLNLRDLLSLKVHVPTDAWLAERNTALAFASFPGRPLLPNVYDAGEKNSGTTRMHEKGRREKKDEHASFSRTLSNICPFGLLLAYYVYRLHSTLTGFDPSTMCLYTYTQVCQSSSNNINVVFSIWVCLSFKLHFVFQNITTRDQTFVLSLMEQMIWRDIYTTIKVSSTVNLAKQLKGVFA